MINPHGQKFYRYSYVKEIYVHNKGVYKEDLYPIYEGNLKYWEQLLVYVIHIDILLIKFPISSVIIPILIEN